MTAPTVRPTALHRRARLMCGAGAAGLLSALTATGANALPGAVTAQQASGALPSAPVLSGPLGKQTETVTLNSQRSLIDWASFNLVKGETVDFQFGAKNSNWIVLNRVGSATSIDGTVNGFIGGTTLGGNVWIVSPNGMLIGKNASINAGGLLLTTSNYTDDANFLKTTNQSFSFVAPKTARLLQIDGGASIQTTGGSLALIASQVQVASGARIGGDALSTALYGAAGGYTITFVDPASANSGLSLFSFVVDTPTNLTTTPLMLAGSTSSGAVYAAGVNKAATVASLISVSGDTIATSATAAGNVIVLNAGGGLASAGGGVLKADGTAASKQQGVSLASSTLTAANATVTAGGAIAGATDVKFVANTVSLAGQGLTLASDLKTDGATTLSAGGGVLSLQAVNTQGGALTLQAGAAAGDFLLNGVTSSGSGATTLATGGALTFGSAADKPVVTDAAVDAITASGVTLSGGTGLTVLNPSVKTAAVTLQTASGDIAFGKGHAAFANGLVLSSAGAVTQDAAGELDVSGGALSGSAGTTLALVGVNRIGSLGDFTTAGALTLADNQSLTVGGAVTTGLGAIALTTLTGNLTVNAALTAGGAASRVSLAATDLSAEGGQVSGTGSITLGGDYSVTGQTLAGVALKPSFAKGGTGALVIDVTRGGFGSGVEAFAAPGGLSITAETGSISLGALTAGGGDIRVVSKTGSVQTGAETASNNVLVSGQTGVTLGALTATGGDVRVVSKGGVVQIDSATAGDDVLVSGQSGATLGAAKLTNAGDADSSALGDGLPLDTGVVGQRQLLVTSAGGAATLGATLLPTASNTFTSAATAASTSAVVQGSTGAAVRLQSAAPLAIVSAPGGPAIALAQTGDLSVGTMSGGTVSAQALTGSVTVGSATANTSIAVTGSAAASLGSAEVQAPVLLLPQLTVSAGTGTATLGAASGQTPTSANLFTTTGSSLLSLASVTSTTGDVHVNLYGSAPLGLLSAPAGSVSAAVRTGDLDIDTLLTLNTGDVTLQAFDRTAGHGVVNVNLGLTLTHNLTITGQAFTGLLAAPLSISNDLSVEQTLGDLGGAAAALTSNGALTVVADAGSVTYASVKAGGAVSITAKTSSLLPGSSGAVTLGTVSGTDVALTAQGAGGIQVGSGLTATGTATLTAPAGPIAVSTGLNAKTLTGSAAGAVTLGGANLVGELGDFTSSQGVSTSTGFRLVDGQTLVVSGKVSDGVGPVSITTTAGDIDLTGTVSGPSSVALTADGALNQTAGLVKGGSVILSGASLLLSGAVNAAGTLSLASQAGIDESAGQITAATLTGSAAGDVTLTGMQTVKGAPTAGNQIGTLGKFTDTAGVLTLTDGQLPAAQTFKVAGPVTDTAGIIAITATGDLTLSGDITGPAVGLGLVSLKASGALDQLSGTVTAGSATLTSGGPMTVSGALKLDPLAGVATLTSKDALDLAASGTVTAGSASLTSAGLMTVAGTLQLDPTAGVATLISKGAIDERLGKLTASTLTGSAITTALLTGTNAVGTLAGFTSTGGFALADGPSLTVAKPVGDTTGPVSIAVTTGDLTLASDVSASTSGTITLTAQTGALTQSAGTVTGRSATLTSGAAMTLSGSLALDTMAGTATLISGGKLDESAGAIASAILTGASNGDTALTGTNAVTTLARFTDPIGAFAFTAAGPLTVSGPVAGAVDGAGKLTAAGGPVTLKTTAGTLTLAGDVDAGLNALTLTSAGPISQTAGTLTGVLTASSVGGLSLPDDNALSGVGAVANTGSGDVSLVSASGIAGLGSITNDVGGLVVTVKTGDLSLGTVSSAGATSDMTLQALDPTAGAGGLITVAGLTVGRDLVLRGQGLQIGAPDGFADTVHPSFVAATGRNLSLDITTGDFTAGALSPVGGDLRLEAHNGAVSIGSAAAGDDIFLRADAGTLALGAATLTGVKLDGVTPVGGFDAVVAADGLTVSDGALAVDRQSGLRQLALTASGAVTLGAAAGTTPTASDSFSTGAAASGVYSELASDTAGVTVNLASAAPVSLVEARGGDALVAVADGLLDAGDVRASGGVSLSAANGDLRLGVAQAAGGTASVVASGNVVFDLQSGGRPIDEATPGVSALGALVVQAGDGIGPDTASALPVPAPVFLAGGSPGATASSLTLQAGGALVLQKATADADIVLTAGVGGVAVATALQAGDAIHIDTTGPISAGNASFLATSQGAGPGYVGLEASAITATGASVTVSSANADADVSITALSGNALVGSATGANVSVGAAQLASLGTAVAGGDLFVGGAVAQLGGGQAGLDGFVVGTGTTATVGSLAAGRDGLVSGQTDAVAGSLQAGRDATVIATNGAAKVATDIAAGDDVQVSAAGTADIASAEAGLGTPHLNGVAAQYVDLGHAGSNITVSTGGDITTGALTANENIGLTSSKGAVSNTGALRALNDISLTGASIDTTNGALTAGRAAFASTQPVAEAASPASISLVATAGDVIAGPLQAESNVGVTASGAMTLFPAVKAGEAINISAGGDVTAQSDLFAQKTYASADPKVGQADGLGDTINIASSGGALRLANATADEDIVLNAKGNVGFATLTAGDDVVATSAAGSIGLDPIGGRLGGVVLAQGQTSKGYAILDNGQGKAGSNIALTAAQDVSLDTLKADSDVDVTSQAGAVRLGTATAGDDLTLAAATLLTAASLNAQTSTAVHGVVDLEGDGSNLRISPSAPGAALAVDVSALQADGAIVIAGGSAANSLSSPAIQLGTATAGEDLSVTASGAIVVGTAIANRDVILQSGGGALQLTRADAGRNATLIAGAAADVTTLLAGLDATVTAAGDVMAGRIGALGSVSVTSTGGAVSATKVQAGAGSGPADDAGPVAGLIPPTAYQPLANAEPSHDVLVKAAGDARVQDIWSTGDATVWSTGSDAVAGLNLAGAAAAGEARAGDDLTVSADGRAWLAAGTLTPSGADSAGPFDAAGDGAYVKVLGHDAILGALPADVGADRLTAAAAAPTDITTAYHLTLPATASDSSGANLILNASGGLASVRVAPAAGAASSLRVSSVTGGDVFVETVGLDTQVLSATSGDDLYVSAYGGDARLRGGALTSTADAAGDGFNVAVKATGAGRTAVVGADWAVDATGQPVYAVATPGSPTYAITGLDLASGPTGPDAFNVVSIGGDAVANLVGDYRLRTLSAAGNALAASAGGSISAWSVTAGADAFLATKLGDINVEQAAAGDDLLISAGRDAALRSATLTAAGPQADADGAGGLDTANGAYRLVLSAGRTATLGRAAGLAPTAATAAPPVVVLAKPAASSVIVEARAGGGGDANVDLDASAQLTSVYGDRNATLRVQGDLAVTGANADPSSAPPYASDRLRYGVVAGSGDVDINAGGMAALQRVAAGGAVSIATGGPLSVTALNAGTTAALTSDDAVTLASLTTAGTVSLTTARDLTVTGQIISTSGDIALTSTGGSATLASLTAAGALSVSTEGALNLQVGSAAGPAILASGDAQDVASLKTAGAAKLTSGDTLTVGRLTAGQAVSLTSASDLAVTGNVTSAAADIGVTSHGGAATLASLNAAGGLAVSTFGAAALQTGTVGAAASFTTGGPLSIGALTVGGPATLASGDAASVGTLGAGQAVTLTAAKTIAVTGALTSAADVNVTSTGGDANLANLGAGGVLAVSTRGATNLGAGSAVGSATFTSGGPLTVGALMSEGPATLISGDAASLGALNAGGAVSLTAVKDISVSTAITSAAGDVDVTSTGGGAMLAGLRTTGTAQVLTAGSAAVSGLKAHDVLVKAGGDETLSGLDVTATAALSSLGTVNLGSASAPAGMVGTAAEVRAGDLNVGGTFSASVFTVEARYGGVALGAVSPGSAKVLSLGQSDFDDLQGAPGGKMALAIYAGLRPTLLNPAAALAGETATMGDATVGALQLDSSRIASLGLYAAPSQKVSVTGALAPKDSAATLALTIGDPSDTAWQPSLIQVVNDGGRGSATGAIGAASGGTERAFGTVALNATHDILFGAAGFIAAVQATPAQDINLTRNIPAVVPNVSQDELLVADTLSVQAQGKVLQQNTAGAQGQASGVLLGAAGVTGPLLTIGTTDPTGAQAAPSVVEFFLTLDDNGALLTRQIAASSSRIKLQVDPSNDYRVNGCVIGASGNCTPIDNFIVEIQPDRLTEVDLLRRAEDQNAEDPTVTGAANEEIWRKPE